MHLLCPRTRRLGATSLRSCARLRLRGYPPLRYGAFLDNHEIAFGYESFTAARHLRAVSLVSRHFPPLHVALCRFGSRAAPTLGCSSAVRCVLHSRMHAAWLGVEYHILRQSAHLRGALRIPSLERSRVSCRASPCSVALSVATFPIYCCGASCAL